MEHRIREWKAYTGAPQRDARIARYRRRYGPSARIGEHLRNCDLIAQELNQPGAVDAMMALRSESNRLRLSCEKAKDAKQFEPIDLRLKPVEGSCVVVSSKAALGPTTEALARQHLQALQSLALDFLDDGATATQWEAASRVPHSSFYRTRTDLVRGGYVGVDKPGRGAHYCLTDSGLRAIGTKIPNGAASIPSTKAHPSPQGSLSLESQGRGTKPDHKKNEDVEDTTAATPGAWS